ncbi:MAG: fibronectin type III domain-containing protein [Streptosporangiaceae bacterium]
MPAVRAPAAAEDEHLVRRASSISFSDGLDSQTTYFYHVELMDLQPGSRYYYQVSDGTSSCRRQAPESPGR